MIAMRGFDASFAIKVIPFELTTGCDLNLLDLATFVTTFLLGCQVFVEMLCALYEAISEF